MIEPGVIGLVLLAALLHAVWNAIVKSAPDALVSLFLVKVPTMVISLGVLAFTGLPDAASFAYTIGSALAFALYCFLLAGAYRVADFNLVYPVARGVAPPLVALLAVVFIGEIPSTGSLVGILTISVAVLWLAYRPGAWVAGMTDVLRAAGVGLCIAVYTLFDGVGVRLSGNWLAYAALLHLVSGVPMAIVVAWVRRDSAFATLARDWKRGVIGGALMFTAYAIVIYALTLSPMAPIAALRETSVIFGALIGTFVLRETLGAKRIAAAAAVAIGIAVLSLFDAV